MRQLQLYNRGSLAQTNESIVNMLILNPNRLTGDHAWRIRTVTSKYIYVPIVRIDNHTFDHVITNSDFVTNNLNKVLAVQRKYLASYQSLPEYVVKNIFVYPTSRGIQCLEEYYDDSTFAFIDYLTAVDQVFNTVSEDTMDVKMAMIETLSRIATTPVINIKEYVLTCNEIMKEWYDGFRTEQKTVSASFAAIASELMFTRMIQYYVALPTDVFPSSQEYCNLAYKAVSNIRNFEVGSYIQIADNEHRNIIATNYAEAFDSERKFYKAVCDPGNRVSPNSPHMSSIILNSLTRDVTKPNKSDQPEKIPLWKRLTKK